MIFINKRKIGISIFLSIITLGIYQIYWMYLLVKNIRAVQKDDSGCVGEMLCLLLVPFYSYYWWFTRGKTVREEFTDHGYSVSGNETAYLILAIFGLDIVSMAIMQNDFNSYPTGSSRSVYNHDLPFVEEEDDIILLKHLTKHFPIKTNLFGKVLVSVKAVNDVSIKVKKGTTLGVVGESGCGKTTMGRTMLRLYDITSGEIIYKGLDLTRLTTSELRKILPPDSAYDTVRHGSREELLEVLSEIGVNINQVPRSAMRKLRPDLQIIFQDPYSSLSPRMTVGAIIGEAVSEHNIVPKSEYRDYVLKIMKECGLQPYYFDRYPHEFSGGQRQRICIARALALNPKVVICDEPVSALDVSIQAQIINLLKDLQEQHGITYVFISHDLSVVKHISTDVAVMYLGSLMEKAPTGAIFDSPLHPYTKALLSAVPVPDPNVKMNRIILEGDIPSPANPPAGCKFHTRCSECMEICKSVEPKLVEYAPDHFVACHLYQKENADATETETKD